MRTLEFPSRSHHVPVTAGNGTWRRWRPWRANSNPACGAWKRQVGCPCPRPCSGSQSGTDRAVGSDRRAPSWRAARSRMHACTPRTPAYARPARARLPRATPPPVAVCALYVRASTHTANSRLGPSLSPRLVVLHPRHRRWLGGTRPRERISPATLPPLLSPRCCLCSLRARLHTQSQLSAWPVSLAPSRRPHLVVLVLVLVIAVI